MKRPDPWDGVAAPTAGGDLFGHLILESRPHDMFRARDRQGRRVLFMVHDPRSIEGTTLPQLAGIEVVSRSRADDGKGLLALHLQSDDDAEIFSRLCDDVVDTVAGSRDERTAVRAFIRRTWKWHDLLKGSRRNVLGRESQLGLIGELHALQHVLAPSVGITAAANAWKGSSGAPKDFELPNACVECKSRGASSRSKVRITSEHQLADVPGARLALLVLTFASDGSGGGSTVDLHEAVDAVRGKLKVEAPHALDEFDANLDEAGYEAGHDYEVRVSHLSDRSYEVIDGFPRIVPGTAPDGPVEISYDLPFEAIDTFELTSEDFAELISGVEGS